MSVVAATRRTEAPGGANLDEAAQAVLEACGTVCLLTGLARCLWCQVPMSVKIDADAKAHYVCGHNGRGAHTIPVERADADAWDLHVTNSSRVLRAVVDPRQKRRMLYRAYAAVVVDTDPDAPQPVTGMYARPLL
ncbi:MAG: hypothetical protein ACRDXX_01850 [Stackebrandtia sp.]